MVKEERVPDSEGIRNALSRVDFSDTFSTTNHQDSLEEIAKLIFGKKPPAWVQGLFRFRIAVGKLFGLKSVTPDDYSQEFSEGGYIGFFKIFRIAENEIIVGEDDKHLKFRASILKTDEPDFNIKVTTLVEFNNAMGKMYMFSIGPFHRMVVKSMIKNAEKRNKDTP
ncbi:hypothetical protein FUAX_38760 (plasmid) [Fulvitalea axinellae]|uniref:DUF2867 domain-containing protein n=1 Tax=Fulvitalea axinellae TaxID=1182444 RepID=A0AAU9CGY1_9BACT|nr:hypothetical protein FUAX_38760 [Fulvitalea axinellae]